jgi:hypothetical protein
LIGIGDEFREESFIDAGFNGKAVSGEDEIRKIIFQPLSYIRRIFNDLDPDKAAFT